MLVQYTAISSLSPAEIQELRLVTSQMVLEGRRYIDFYGKFISVSELMAHKQIWENERRATTRQSLFG